MGVQLESMYRMGGREDFFHCLDKLVWEWTCVLMKVHGFG